ncbi:MAG TPA: sigma-54 dependent transcriptional regulator, partial [Blastocatellia bacterium]|nr:sigma-54 dependent transcriptional regulator [Blastocatellia bacterium]
VDVPALLAIVERLCDGHRSRQSDLAPEQRDAQDALDPFIGQSASVSVLRDQAMRLAEADGPVLVQGETGSGKGVLTRWLHGHGRRREQRLVDLNCAGLSRELLENELFGHERGAFTGAVSQKRGRFELADGGTLLLDEIGELSSLVQAKLLRVVQTGEFERVGGTETIKVDARLVGATNRELEREVAAGRFRADLFYRLNLFPISLPPLRERREDIGPLAEHCLAKFARAHGKQVRRFSPRALELLEHYDWPGNVRELENTIERAVVVADGQTIQPDHLPPAVQAARLPDRVADGGLFESVEAYEKGLICDALRNTRGNRNQAAKLLKVSERVLSYKVKKHAIDCDAFRSSQ